MHGEKHVLKKKNLIKFLTIFIYIIFLQYGKFTKNLTYYSHIGFFDWPYLHSSEGEPPQRRLDTNRLPLSSLSILSTVWLTQLTLFYQFLSFKVRKKSPNCPRLDALLVSDPNSYLIDIFIIYFNNLFTFSYIYQSFILYFKIFGISWLFKG